jgi:hypothetical protein
MWEVLGQAQIVFVHADGCLMFEEGVDVPGPVYFPAPRWHLSSISFLVHVFFLTLGSHS